MLAGDRAGDGEAETDAAGLGVARALDAVERFEDLLAFAARNAGPAILDGERRCVRPRRSGSPRRRRHI